MIKLHQKILLLLIIPTLITGCGFTTYNTASLPSQLKQIYYQTESPFEPFAINFRNRLKSAEVKLLSSPQKSALIMKVNSNYNSNTDNYDSSTRARTYNLNYSATITICDYYNKQIVGPATANVPRKITLQPNEVFEASTQIPLIKKEMQQELIIKILNIFNAPKTIQALQNK